MAASLPIPYSRGFLRIPLAGDANFQSIDQFSRKQYRILDSHFLISIPYRRLFCVKTIPLTVAHTYTAHTWK